MERSCFTLDLGAIRRNAATLLRAVFDFVIERSN